MDAEIENKEMEKDVINETKWGGSWMDSWSVEWEWMKLCEGGS